MACKVQKISLTEVGLMIVKGFVRKIWLLFA
jgi:hypothetical protein